MIDLHTSKPLYEQIKVYLLHRIQSGELQPHTKLPSERDLAEQFSVSRLTVSKAVKELEQAGWVYVQIGKGTYVGDQPIHQEIAVLTSFTEEMATRGQSTHSRVLQAQRIIPESEVAERLQLPPGAKVIQLERVRYANNRPIALENSFVNAPASLLDHNFAQQSLYKTLSTHFEIRLTYAEQSFEARAASNREAQHLNLRPGSPVLYIYRVSYTATDHPIEVVHSVYRGDRYRFRAVLRRLSE